MPQSRVSPAAQRCYPSSSVRLLSFVRGCEQAWRLLQIHSILSCRQATSAYRLRLLGLAEVDAYQRPQDFLVDDCEGQAPHNTRSPADRL